MTWCFFPPPFLGGPFGSERRETHLHKGAEGFRTIPGSAQSPGTEPKNKNSRSSRLEPEQTQRRTEHLQNLQNEKRRRKSTCLGNTEQKEETDLQPEPEPPADGRRTRPSSSCNQNQNQHELCVLRRVSFLCVSLVVSDFLPLVARRKTRPALTQNRSDPSLSLPPHGTGTAPCADAVQSERRRPERKPGGEVCRNSQTVISLRRFCETGDASAAGRTLVLTRLRGSRTSS